MLKRSYTEPLEAGVDEAGRGALMGPVTAAAVILPEDFSNPLINDSKQLTERQRYTLREVIESEAVCFAVSHVREKTIDRINILNASILAMHQALKLLKTSPLHILVDGNRFKPFRDIKHLCIIKGDTKYMNIAAASILAKTYRDDFVKNLHIQYPDYQWNKNKGYPTAFHRKAIREIGSTPLHRESFKLLTN